MAEQKIERRTAREKAVKGLNQLACHCEEEPVKARPTNDEVVGLCKRLAASLPQERRSELQQLRDQFQENGGCGDFPDLPDPALEVVATENADQVLPSHSLLRATVKKAFRLQSKAFMLTFNCLHFVASTELWTAFQKRVEDRAHEFKA